MTGKAPSINGHRRRRQLDDALVHLFVQHYVAQGSDAATTVLLGHERGVDAGFLGYSGEALPVLSGQAADDSHQSLGNATGTAIVYTFLRRMSQVLCLQG